MTQPVSLFNDEYRRSIVSSREVSKQVRRFREKMTKIMARMSDEKNLNNRDLMKELMSAGKEFEQLELLSKGLPNSVPRQFAKNIFFNLQEETECGSRYGDFLDHMTWNEQNLFFYAFGLNEMLESRTPTVLSTTSKHFLETKTNPKPRHSTFHTIFNSVQLDLLRRRQAIQVDYLIREYAPSVTVVEVRCGVFFNGSFITRQKILLLVDDGELTYVNIIAGHENWSFDDEFTAQRLDITSQSRYEVFQKLTISANRLLNETPNINFSTDANDMMRTLYIFGKFGDVFDARCFSCKKTMQSFFPPTVINLVGNRPIFLHEQCL